MLKRCPQCHTEAQPRQFICEQCGLELQPGGTQLETLTYWSASKTGRTFKYAGTVLAGVALTVALHHIAPCVIGLAVAAFLYIRDYK